TTRRPPSCSRCRWTCSRAYSNQGRDRARPLRRSVLSSPSCERLMHSALRSWRAAQDQPPTLPLRTLDIQADLAEMLAGLLMAEGIGDALQRESAIDHGSYAVCLDGADHLQLLLAVADGESLQADLVAHQQRRRDIPCDAGKHSDQGNVPAQPTGGNGLRKRAGSTDLHDMIHAATAGEGTCGLAPVFLLAVVD